MKKIGDCNAFPQEVCTVHYLFIVVFYKVNTHQTMFMVEGHVMTETFWQKG